MDIVTRKQAKEHNLEFYYTGKQCKRGHTSKRRTSTGDCMECVRLRDRERYAQTEGEYHKQYYRENRETKIEKQMIRQQSKHDDYLAYQKQWREQNKERIELYRKENAEKYAYHTAKRRSNIKRATPVWHETEEIMLLYKNAKDRSLNEGIEYHVDHDIPLVHELVCGLHCLANLRIIPKIENLQKHNTYIVSTKRLLND